MWNIFKKSNTIVLPSPPKAGWRRSMWVMTSKGVGIIVGIQDELFVHLVNSKGETIAQELFPFSETRQANVNEIPEPRRPTREVAERLGY